MDKYKKIYIELGITITVTIVSLILYLTIKNEYVVDAMRSVFWLSLYMSYIYLVQLYYWEKKIILRMLKMA